MTYRRGCSISRGRLILGLMCGCMIAGCVDKASTGPAATAASQEDALSQAKHIDLPLLSRADRAVLTSVMPPIGAGKSVEITDVNRLRRLVAALTPGAVPPSGGMEAATIRFYQGPALLREVWVYPGGEWGFRRPETSWTTGRSDELERLIQEELARAAVGK